MLRLTSTTFPVNNTTQSVSYGYDLFDRLNKITRNGQVYNFQYDAFGRTTKTQVGTNTALSTTTYRPNSNLADTVTLASGYGLKYIYDDWDNLLEVQKLENNCYAQARGLISLSHYKLLPPILAWEVDNVRTIAYNRIGGAEEWQTSISV